MQRHHALRRTVTFALALSLVTAIGPVASAEPPAPPAPSAKRGFDYWQPEWMVKELWGPGRMPKGMMARLLRHTTYMNYGVPAEYDGAKSPLAAGADAKQAGAAIYARECASCHGKDGLGDGDAENALSPSPALLAYMIRRPIAVDEYLLWTVSEGGAHLQSQMPAFKEKLTRDEIWQVIAYMRSGFPQVDAGGKALPPSKAK